jgi:hypothetical protein
MERRMKVRFIFRDGPNQTLLKFKDWKQFLGQKKIIVNLRIHTNLDGSMFPYYKKLIKSSFPLLLSKDSLIHHQLTNNSRTAMIPLEINLMIFSFFHLKSFVYSRAFQELNRVGEAQRSVWRSFMEARKR